MKNGVSMKLDMHGNIKSNKIICERYIGIRSMMSCDQAQHCIGCCFSTMQDCPYILETRYISTTPNAVSWPFAQKVVIIKCIFW